MMPAFDHSVVWSDVAKLLSKPDASWSEPSASFPENGAAHVGVGEGGVGCGFVDLDH
jgi:hypothetical protein